MGVDRHSQIEAPIIIRKIRHICLSKKYSSLFHKPLIGTRSYTQRLRRVINAVKFCRGSKLRKLEKRPSASTANVKHGSRVLYRDLR
jgi:hypothetical protein